MLVLEKMSNEAEARTRADIEPPAGVDYRRHQHENPCASCQMVLANPNQVTCSRGACQYNRLVSCPDSEGEERRSGHETSNHQGFPAQEMASKSE